MNVFSGFIHVSIRNFFQVQLFVDPRHLSNMFRLRSAIALLQGCQLGRVGPLPGHNDEPSESPLLDVGAVGVDKAVDVVPRDLQEVSDFGQDGVCNVVDSGV